MMKKGLKIGLFITGIANPKIKVNFERFYNDFRRYVALEVVVDRMLYLKKLRN